MGNRVTMSCLCCLKPSHGTKQVREVSVASDHTYQEVASPVKAETFTPEPDVLSSTAVPNSKWNLKAISSALEEAIAHLVVVAETTDELPLLVNKPDVKVYGKETTHGFLIKTCWETDVTPETFLEFARDRNLRPEWDANIDQCRLISPITGSIDAIYERYKKVTMVSQRDVVIASTAVPKAEAWVAVSTSIESDEVPLVPGILRANMHVGGYYVRATPNGAAVTSVSELNFGGSLPNSLLVRMSAMAMPGYVKSLSAALAKHGSENTNL